MLTNDTSPVLYRYFFFSWLFRDAASGNLFERRAAWRYNQAQSRWLPTYLRRWMVLSVLLFASGCLCSVVFHGPWVSVPFYVLFSVAIPISSVIVVAWLGLRLMPGP